MNESPSVTPAAAEPAARPFHDSSVRVRIPLPISMKDRLRWWGPSRAAWIGYRCWKTLHEYERRREHYAREAEARGLSYDEAAVTHAIRKRIAERGYAPATRHIGEVHTFACIPQFGWHHHLLPDLQELGPVTLFDYTKYGYTFDEFVRADSSGIRRRAEMVKLLLPQVRAAHAERPIDWMFCYGGGQDISPGVMQQITDELGIPTVSMSLDDKHGWAGPQVGECRTGTVDLSAVFDMYMTSSTLTCEWHLVEGGRPIYMPEGFDASWFKPRDVPQDIPVSFVGAAYGYRAGPIRFLQARGLDVRTFGTGWPGSSWAPDMAEVFCRSRINIGMGGMDYCEDVTNVKARDFEIPGTGGGVYLTTFNSDLARHFDVGREILCYHSRHEMLELARYYLARPDEAREIAVRGRERCLREHRWFHRFEKTLRILGILPTAAGDHR